MFSFIALTCWIAALVVVAAIPPLGLALGVCGFAAAQKAHRLRDDVEGLFGVMLQLVLVVGLIHGIGALV